MELFCLASTVRAWDEVEIKYLKNLDLGELNVTGRDSSTDLQFSVCILPKSNFKTNKHIDMTEDKELTRNTT